MVIKVLNYRIERSRRLVTVSKNGRSLGFMPRKGNDIKDIVSVIKILLNKIKH